MQLSSAYLPLAASAGGHPGSAPSATINSSGALSGFSVSVLPTITAFFSSLSPAYDSAHKRQVPELAPANRPKTPSSQVVTDDVTQKVKLVCNVLSSWVPSMRVASEVVATICSSLSLSRDFSQVLEGNKGGKRPSTPARIPVPISATLALIALDNLGAAAAVPAPGERGSPQNPIPVLDSETLSKIGQHDDYPEDAYYVQGNSFSHVITEPGALFSGNYDGDCHTISGLKTCLFSDIGRHGVVRNLRLDNITIDYDLPAQGVLACEMSPFATARDIQVERAEVRNQANGEITKLAATGALVGHLHHSALITDIDLRDCAVYITGSYMATGIVAGRVDGQLKGINIANCQVYSRGRASPTGIGAGQLKGQIKDLLVYNSQATAMVYEADAGIGAGWVMPGGSIERMSTKKCDALAEGRTGSAGIGGGVVIGNLDHLTVVDSSARTSDIRGFAGIGGGRVGDQKYGNLSQVSNMFCIRSSVQTDGVESSAGVIAGRLHGKAREVTSLGCVVASKGDNSKTGVGVGINNGEISNFTSVIDLASNKDNSSALVAGDRRGVRQNIASLDTLVNGQRETTNPPASLSGLCANADPHLVDSNCSSRQFEQSPWQCASVPPDSLCGSVSLPIEVSDEDTMNSIGCNASLPSNAHYLQTRDLDGTKLNVNGSLVFDGHYDGGNHIIRNQHSCLFDRLRGTVKNLQLTGARITGDGKDAAVVVCKMDDGSIVEDIWIGNGSVTTHGPALAGLVSARRTGEFNRVSRIEIHNASVATHADAALAGAVAGQSHGVTEQVDVHHTRVKTHGRGAHAGLAGGRVSGRLESFTSTCSQVATAGPGGKAGMGAGVLVDGQLKGMTVVNGSVSTTGNGNDAGVGAGRMQGTSQLTNINTLFTKVHTTGRGSSGGIGAGHMVGSGTLTDITGVQSEVETTGDGANAGFGVGTINARHQLSGLTSVYNAIRSKGIPSRASITGNLAGGGTALARDTITEHTWVNFDFKDEAINPNLRDSFCADADQRLVAPNCHINRTALPGNCAPVQFASSPSLTVPPVTCDQVAIADISVVPRAPTNSSGNHSLVPSSLEPLPVTTAAPLIAGLSTNVIGGIVAGSTAFVIGACIVACCCYHSCCSKDEPMAEESDDDVSL